MDRDGETVEVPLTEAGFGALAPDPQVDPGRDLRN